MAKTIALIRAANVLPLVRWMEVNGHDAGTYLEEADLGYWFNLGPLDPIPVLNGIDLLRLLARDHGPDVGVAIVTQASIAELAFIGQVALGSRTPADALNRIARAIPMHSSHETIRIVERDAIVEVSEAFGMEVAAEGLHAVQVLFCAMVQQLCRFTGNRPPLLARIEMEPHPHYGLEHVVRHFGDRVSASRDHTLRITIDAHIANNPFRVVARDRMRDARGVSVPPLAEEPTLAASVRPVIAAMLHGGEPTIGRLARAGGMSVRSMQRRLAEEQTSFSEELDRVRAALAMRHLRTENVSLSDLSERLGYSSQSALTRAVRRLTGSTPGLLKQRAG